MYEGRIKGPTGDWLPCVFTGDSQHVTSERLTPGAIYPAQVRALGGSTGQSGWSDRHRTWRYKSEGGLPSSRAGLDRQVQERGRLT